MTPKSNATSEREGSNPEGGGSTVAESGGTPETKADPDAEWVAATLQGDPLAFEKLVVRHQNRIYTRIYFMVNDRETAADLCQEVFLKAHVALRGGEPTRKVSSRSPPLSLSAVSVAICSSSASRSGSWAMSGSPQRRRRINRSTIGSSL